MDPDAELKKVVRETLEEFPKFRMKPKADSFMMKAINFFLRMITLGGMKEFMTGYITTIGHTVYVPSGWQDKRPLTRASILRHERVHMRQSRRLTAPLYIFLYLLWILPGGLAIGRRNLEMEAYAESMKAHFEYYGMDTFDDGHRKWMISQFTGPAYFFSWPFRRSIEKWYDSVVESLMATSSDDRGH